MTLKRDPEEQLVELQQEQAATEDSESSSPAAAAPPLTAAARAKKLADEILHTPTTTEQAIELAKVYALIAIAEALPPQKPTPARRTTTKKATS